MKVKLKGSDCYFDSDELDEIREHTKAESTRRIKKNRQQKENESFYSQKKERFKER